LNCSSCKSLELVLEPVYVEASSTCSRTSSCRSLALVLEPVHVEAGVALALGGDQHGRVHVLLGLTGGHSGGGVGKELVVVKVDAPLEGCCPGAGGGRGNGGCTGGIENPSTNPGSAGRSGRAGPVLQVDDVNEVGERGAQGNGGGQGACGVNVGLESGSRAGGTHSEGGHSSGGSRNGHRKAKRAVTTFPSPAHRVVLVLEVGAGEGDGGGGGVKVERGELAAQPGEVLEAALLGDKLAAALVLGDLELPFSGGGGTSVNVQGDGVTGR